jgi:beta-lactamase regulating signal transducer with metallopeptidase domain
MTTQAFFDLAVRQLVQVSILIVAAGILTRVLCRRRPHLAYIFWILVLIKSLTPPLWSSPIGVFSWVGSHRETAATIGVTHATLPLSAPNLHIETFAPAPVLAASQTQTHPWPLASIALAIWGLGCVAFVFAIAVRWFLLRRSIEKSSIRAPRELIDMLEQLRRSLDFRGRLRLRLCDAHVGPAVFGIFRPILVLPATILQNKELRQLRPILAHEIIHLRRRDPLAAGVQILSQAVWWFHPLVWWMNRNITRVRELCCDAEVIASLQCRPDDYAQMLIDALRVGRIFSSPILSMGIRPSQITAHRLDHIMSENPAFPCRTPWIYWLLLILCGLILLPGGQISSRADDATIPAQANTQPAPSTQPTQMQISIQVVQFVRVVVDFNSISFQGRRTTMDELPKLLSQVSDRANTVLEIANASDDLTIGRFNSIEFTCNDLARSLGFKYLSYVGKQPMNSRGSPNKYTSLPAGATLKVLPALPPAPVDQLTRSLPFHITSKELARGDSLVITEIRSNNDNFQVDGTYQVTGTYTLASHKQATLALSITAKDAKNGYGEWGKKQSFTITQGSGTFTLTERAPCEGFPHISFYGDGSTFGGIYFVAGANPAPPR